MNNFTCLTQFLPCREIFILLLTGLALTACKKSDILEQENRTYVSAANTENTQKTFKPTGFTLGSPDFLNNEALPVAHTCEGKSFAAGVTPELEWTAGPDETLSYAIVFADQSLIEAGNPDYAYHWAIWNIPASTHTLPRGIGGVEAYHNSGAIALPSTLGSAEHSQARGLKHYFGPCPSWKHFCTQALHPRVTDTYSFTVYALPESELDVPSYNPQENSNYVDLLNAFFQMRALDRAQIFAHSDAAPSSLPFPCPE